MFYFSSDDTKSLDFFFQIIRALNLDLESSEGKDDVGKVGGGGARGWYRLLGPMPVCTAPLLIVRDEKADKKNQLVRKRRISRNFGGNDEQ